MESIIKAKKLAQKIAKERKIKLKDALEIIAKRNKFKNWKEYKNSLDTFWYSSMPGFLNHWFVIHSEAVNFQNQYGGFILTYKGQYFVASADYINSLGIDPNADIWKQIGFDASTSNAMDKMYKFLKESNYFDL
jgi:hypothetical protein